MNINKSSWHYRFNDWYWQKCPFHLYSEEGVLWQPKTWPFYILLTTIDIVQFSINGVLFILLGVPFMGILMLYDRLRGERARKQRFRAFYKEESNDKP